jgi:hypothetical protein
MKDIQRTQKNITKKDRIEALNSVLLSYSIRNPFLGYCQGLNFIVIQLLNWDFSEEEAFWIFTSILENILPLDLFTPNNIIKFTYDILEYLLELDLPEVFRVFEEFSIKCQSFCFSWITTLFT